MEKIIAVSVEHNNQSSFGWEIDTTTPELALSLAMQRIRFEIETSPGKVTRVWFTYEGDESDG
jgi:hypothetical protein